MVAEISGTEDPSVTKSDFQHLAESRLREAKLLLDRHEYDGAYYLAGYVVEFALKACILKRLADFWPDDKKFIEKCYTHVLTDLLHLANLQTEIFAGPVGAKWLLVKDWSEQRRFKRGTSEADATDFFNAINHPTEGVFQWLKARW